MVHLDGQLHVGIVGVVGAADEIRIVALPAASSLMKLMPQRSSAIAAAATTRRLSSYSLRPGACAPWSNAPVVVMPCPTPRYAVSSPSPYLDGGN